MKKVFVLSMFGLVCIVLANGWVVSIINEYQTAPDSLQWVELYPLPKGIWSYDFYVDSIVTSKGSTIINWHFDPSQGETLKVVPLPGMINKDNDTIRVYWWWPDNVSWAPCRPRWPPPAASVSLYRSGDYFHEYIDFTPTPGLLNDDLGFIKGVVADTAGKPLLAYLYARNSYDSIGINISELSGYGYIDLGVGKYYVCAEAEGYPRQVYPESVEVTSLDTTVVNFTFPQGIKEQEEFSPIAFPQFSVVPLMNEVKIIFQLPKSMEVKVTVFDGSGRVVKELFAGRADNRPHTLYWDRRDRFGKTMPAGFYFVTLEAGKSMITKKVVVVK